MQKHKRPHLLARGDGKAEVEREEEEHEQRKQPDEHGEDEGSCLGGWIRWCTATREPNQVTGGEGGLQGGDLNGPVLAVPDPPSLFRNLE